MLAGLHAPLLPGMHEQGCAGHRLCLKRYFLNPVQTLHLQHLASDCLDDGLLCLDHPSSMHTATGVSLYMIDNTSHHALELYEWAVAEIRAADIGTRAGLFEVQKIGDEFFTFIVDCDKPKACSIVLRGASKVLLQTTVRMVVSLRAADLAPSPKLQPLSAKQVAFKYVLCQVSQGMAQLQS